MLFITANWLIGLMWIGATSIEVISRARFEEGLMIDRFGDQYREYMQETGRFVPRLT
jgi:protein-S-isoprenylcysteine O-methyltransferase Ste14